MRESALRRERRRASPTGRLLDGPAPSVRGGRRAVAWSLMTRFVVDCGVVLHLASEGIEVPAEHELLAPTLLRSQTLSALHEAVHRGEIPPDVALERLARIRVMPIRLLGDAVLRRRAWDLAERLGWLRIQRCPVGGHWSLVTPVRPSELTEEETRLARGRKDAWLP